MRKNAKKYHLSSFCHNLDSNILKCSWIFYEETKNGDMLYLQTISMESGMSGRLVCSVSMFETLNTLPESIHFGTLS